MKNIEKNLNSTGGNVKLQLEDTQEKINQIEKKISEEKDKFSNTTGVHFIKKGLIDKKIKRLEAERITLEGKEKRLNKEFLSKKDISNEDELPEISMSRPGKETLDGLENKTTLLNENEEKDIEKHEKERTPLRWGDNINIEEEKNTVQEKPETKEGTDEEKGNEKSIEEEVKKKIEDAYPKEKSETKEETEEEKGDEKNKKPDPWEELEKNSIEIEEITKEELKDEIKDKTEVTKKKWETIKDFFTKKEKEIKEAQEKSGIKEKIWDKTSKWLAFGKDQWKSIDKKAATRVGAQALAIGGITMGIGALTGIGPADILSILGRIGFRGGIPTIINMGMTSDLGKKLLTKGPLEKKGWKKELNFANAATLVGLSTSLALGGWTVALIGLSGYAGRRALNALTDNKIKNAYEKNTEEGNEEAKNWKMAKNILGGAMTIGAGLVTMSALHHDAVVKAAEESNKTMDEALQNIKVKNEAEIKEFERLEALKLKNTFRGEEIEFNSKGAIKTFDDLKAKILRDYPDGLENAPKGVQELLNTDSSQLAIKVGMFDPNNEGGAESALVWKGSSLEVDENGNLIFHDSRTGESHDLINSTIEKYEGKMFDSDHSVKEIEPIIEPNLKDRGSPIEEASPESYKKDNIPYLNKNEDKSLNYFQDDIQKESNLNNVDKDAELITPRGGERSIPTEQNTNPENLENTPSVRNIGNPEDYTKTQWDNSPNNIYKISLEDIKEVNKIHYNNIHSTIYEHSLTENDTRSLVNLFSTGSAINLIESTKNDLNSISEIPLWQSVQDLHRITGLEPRAETPFQLAETPEEYTHRALMKASADHKLDEVRANFREIKNIDLSEEQNKILSGNSASNINKEK